MMNFLPLPQCTAEGSIHSEPTELIFTFDRVQWLSSMLPFGQPAVKSAADCDLSVSAAEGFSLLKSMLIILKDSRKSAPIRWKYKWGIQFKSERKFSVTSCWAPQNSHAELHIHTGEMIGLPWFWKIKKDKRQLRHLGNAWIYLVFSNKSISILQMENGQIKWKTEYLSKASPKRKLSIGKSWDAFNKHHRLHKQLQCSMSYIIQLSSTLMEG